jgi:hypothetical protein
MSTPARHIIIDDATNAAVDLCATCLHASDCVYATPDREPVLQCEFFEIEGAANEVIDEPAKDVEEAPTGLAGLCVNCERRADCTLPRPAGGVWHCEEYA